MAVIDVVRYDGPPHVLAWKNPNTELGTWTQLIVNESQEAVLFKGGQALDVFGPGRHTLATANLPILTGLIRLPFGGSSPFQAEVWYVNRLSVLNVLWGTPTPAQLQDPKYGVMVPVRAYGQFGIRVSDSKRFLVKLVGTSASFDNDVLAGYFKGVYVTKVKDALAGYLVRSKVGILEINAYLQDLSDHLTREIKPFLDEYGIELINFMVNDVSVPEDDPAVQKLKAALAKKAEMDIIGYNYQQERTFDTLEGAATNPGAGTANLMGAGMGLGMGFGVGGAMGNVFGGMAQNLSVTGRQIQCPSCQAMVPEGNKFCPNCGRAVPGAQPAAAIKCSRCGAPMARTDQFCPSCGDPYNPCPDCGADMPVGAPTCPVCGKPAPTPCPGCGQPVKAGSKFCPNCGTAMSKKCPNPACGLESPASTRFCPACGTAL